ncbi:MAG: DUF2127 domain-containing protein [Candidatus Acidiferrum sp.]
MKSTDTKLIRLIAVFKLMKAALLLAVAFGALQLLHADVASVVEHWVARLGLGPGNRDLGRALLKAADLTPNKIRDVVVGSFIYAGLFLTEGIGLWLLKRWAEWFTIILTSTLIPVEVYEIFRHVNALKVLVLIINLLLVGYLVHLVRNKASDFRMSN